MDLTAVIQIVKTYPFADIDKADGGVIRKHIPTSELSEDMLRSYGAIYGAIRIIPKRLMGNAPLRLDNEAISIPNVPQIEPLPATTLATSLGSPYSAQPTPQGENVYKILYENAKEDAREYKRKYEDILTEIRKLEVEHAGSKNSFVGDLAQGLAGFAPLLMGKGMAGLGEASSTPEQPAQHVSQVGTPIKDRRLVNIVTYYNKLEEGLKQKLYELLSLALTSPEKIEKAIFSLQTESPLHGDSDEEEDLNERYP